MKAKLRDLIELFLAIVLCQSAGIIGAVFTFSSVSTWYVGLDKPSFNPPNWVFGPVWTMLYLMMGVSLYLVWGKRAEVNISKPLKLFAVQLVLNTLWSIVFFGFKSPLGGLLVISLLWVAIVSTIYYFRKISQTAAILLVPYILWVSFAAVLNLSIVLLNP